MAGRILIVDDVSTNRIVLKVKLSAAGYDVIGAADGAGCLALAATRLPDLILLDLMLPDMSGIEILSRLRANPVTRQIPVIMFSAGRDASARLDALEAGADDFLSKPIDDETLLARLRSFMRAGQAVAGPGQGFGLIGMADPQATFERPGVVALVTARPETGMHLKRALQRNCTDRIVTVQPDQALRDDGPEAAEVPDVYLIEADLGAPAAGLRLMSCLRSHARSRHAAFCLLNPVQNPANAAIAFDLGADDQVDAQMPASELALRLRILLRRKRHEDRLRASVQDGLRMALIDPLTGLHNRRYGIAQLATIAERAAAEASTFAVMVADLDRFKSVNDRWGHAAGDAVLIEVAARLAANLRASDLIARIGGEEFLIALPATGAAEAQVVAERLCRAIEEQPVTLTSGARLSVTISIGLAMSSEPPVQRSGEPVSLLVECADRALMASKSSGRNMVTISHDAA